MKKREILNDITLILTNLIRFPTFYGNKSAFKDLFNYIKSILCDYYLEDIVVTYDNINHDNLIISNTKDKNYDIIFCCHVDVVSAKEYDVKIQNGLMYGRGSIDMKGQVAVIIELLKNIKSDKKIALILTSDEENGGFCCREIVKKYHSKLAVIPDGGSNFDLIIEEKGVLQLEIKSVGISAHGSEPFNGDNAIIKLINLYNDLIKQYRVPSRDEFKLSITLSKINGGEEKNKVPDYACMNLDIRYTKDDDINKLLDYIKNYSKDINYKILDLEPVFFVDEKLDIIKNFINNCEMILKRKVNLKRCCAGSDAPYFSCKGIPVIMMNPIGANWHGDNEYVEIDSLYTLYEIFMTLL